MSDYWWLYYRTADEDAARAAFVLRFGREPERREWDAGEGCWWLGMISEKELTQWKHRRQGEPWRQLELAL